MSIFHKTKKKFLIVGEQPSFTVENQDGLIDVENELTINRYFDIMLEDNIQHIILKSPAAISNIRYVQAVREGLQVEVQIGVEEDNATILYHIYCDEKEARQIFMDFYHGKFVPDRKRYTAVEFL